MKKIIAIVAVIATITACLCIGTNAYDEGETITAGTRIKLKEKITNFPTADTSITATFESNGNTYTRIYVNSAETVQYKAGTNTPTTVYSNNRWTNDNYRTITIIEDLTLSEYGARFFDSNVDNSLNQTVKNVKSTFSTTLTLATAIIAWLMVNQIALVGLYMYILIALIATGKRFIIGA